jgi:hypothetical protein
VEDLQKSEHELWSLNDPADDMHHLNTNDSDGSTGLHTQESHIEAFQGITRQESELSDEDADSMLPLPMQRSPSSLQGPPGHQTLLQEDLVPSRAQSPLGLFNVSSEVLPSFPLTLRRQNAITPEPAVS